MTKCDLAWRFSSQGLDPALAEREGGALRSTAARPSRAIFSSHSPAPRTTGSNMSPKRRRRARRRRRRTCAAVPRRGLPSRRRRARRARARRLAFLSAPAGDDRRRDRHERQNLRRRIRPPDLARLGFEAASLGTIGIVSRPMTIYGSLTTPDPIALHQRLDQLAAEASRIWRWKPLRTDSTRSGLTAFALSPARSPICRAIIWTITRRARTISPPSFGCSDLLPAGAAAVIDADSARRRA